MFWGSISGHGKGPSLFWEKNWGTISSATYCEHTVPVIHRYLQDMLQDGIILHLMQDGAGGHSARATIAELNARGIFPVMHPSLSPGLNPIETIWNWMKDYI